MRVVYDVSVLGFGQMYPSARAGVFRGVEQLAFGLAATDECRVSFSVTQPARLLLRAQEYLASHPQLARVPILTPPHDLALVRGLDRRLLRLEQAGRVSYLQLLEWQVVPRILRTYERLAYRPWRYVREAADVFHSPHFALPPPEPRGSAPQRFLTIYDLIPVRFPQWCDTRNLAVMDAVYASLGPEDWALAISECTKRDLCELRGTDPQRVFVTPLAADPQLFHPCSDEHRQAAVRRRYGIPDAPYLLSLNTLEPRKNLDHAIRAFVDLVRQERLDDLHLVLVGSQGWKYEKIFAAIAEAGAVKQRIVVAGYVADEDLAALYSGALAFVYPSLYEGFGLPPLEAMQCGVPVIAANNSALPEVVGEAGILVEARDREALSQAMLRVWQSAELRQQMQQRSLARAREFSWERCVRLTLDAYRTALAS